MTPKKENELEKAGVNPTDGNKSAKQIHPNGPDQVAKGGNEHQLPDGSPRHGRDTSIPDEDRIRETQKNAVPAKTSPEEGKNPASDRTGQRQS